MKRLLTAALLCLSLPALADYQAPQTVDISKQDQNMTNHYKQSRMTAAAQQNQASKQYDMEYKHNGYRRNFNIRFLGSGMFSGWMGASLDFEVMPSYSIGPFAKGFMFSNNDGYIIGIHGNYAVNHNIFKDGWLLSPYIGFLSTDYKRNNTKNSLVLGGNLVYQWMFHNSFNAQLGGGVFYAKTRMPLTPDMNGDLYLTVLASLGYAF